MDAVEERWRKDYHNVYTAIPSEWVITLEDGSQWIDVPYKTEPLVQMLGKLATVGYARGWL